MIEDLKLLSPGGFSKEKIQIFFEYLEENDLMNPLIITNKGSNFGQQNLLERGRFLRFEKYNKEKKIYVEDYSILDEIDSYYHPFQFFQFMIYFKYLKENDERDTMYEFYESKKFIELEKGPYAWAIKENRINKKKEIIKIEKEIEREIIKLN